MLQVGPGDGYKLTVGGFNDPNSTLGDSLTNNDWDNSNNNGMKFSTK